MEDSASISEKLKNPYNISVYVKMITLELGLPVMIQT